MRTKCADWVCSFVVEKTLNETFKIKGETTNKKTWPASEKIIKLFDNSENQIQFSPKIMEI